MIDPAPYPLANVLREGPNVSRRPASHHRAFSVASLILSGAGIGLMAWTLFIIALNLSGR